MTNCVQGDHQYSMNSNKIYSKRTRQNFLTTLVFVAAYALLCCSEFKEMTDSLGNRALEATSQKCDTSLNKLAIDMAKYSTPEGSASWAKNKRVLSQVKKFHVENPNELFADTTKNIITALTSYGLERLRNETVDCNRVHDTVLVEYAVFRWRPNQSCKGSRDDSIPRIIIQTEQIKFLDWAPQYIKECDNAPNCVVWDFSDANFEWAKTIGASDSFMIVPHMFHDRLQHVYQNEEDLLPYHNRSVDATFFGTITERRELFQQRYLSHDKLLSSYNMRFELNMEFEEIPVGYSNTKICLVLHSYNADSGGEYHRLSDFKRFGCIPVMEKFSDQLAVDTLSTCAGIVFSDYDNIASAVNMELKRMEETSPEILREQQLAIDQWWRAGIHWDTFLEAVLGRN